MCFSHRMPCIEEKFNKYILIKETKAQLQPIANSCIFESCVCVWLVERWRPFVLRKIFLLISDVSVGRYVACPHCCCYILGRKERKKENLGQILFLIFFLVTVIFTVISFEWTSLNAVSSSGRCAIGTSGAMSLQWGEDTLWKNNLRKKAARLFS